jgi:hypothetical protein
MLTLTKGLVPHVEKLLPALRSGTIHKDLAPIVAFVGAYGPGRGKDVLQMLHDCPAWLFDSVAHELNSQLLSLNAAPRVTAADLLALKGVVQLYWTTLGCYVH